MTKYRIWLSPPHIDGNEQKYVQEAFDSNWVAPVGPHISRFENELGEYLGNEVYVTALSSGTAAIHLALLALGVGKGDDVICSSFTFSGSCNPINYVGANPIFVDSESTTWNMDPDLLHEAILKGKKGGKMASAIILVHLYGMPARISEIKEIARQYDIPIVEDAAEALGSKYYGRHLGTFGDIGILSFNGNKIITTSGGGAMISRTKRLTDNARFLSTQARDNAPHYEHSEIGYNYRLSNVCAGIGRGQLERIEEKVRKRRAIFQRYYDTLSEISGIDFCIEQDEFFSNRWLTTLLFPSKQQREDVRNSLEEMNVESRPLWKPMHLQPVFRNVTSFTNGVSQNLFERGLCLPSGSSLSTEDQDSVIQCVMNRILKT